MNFPEFPCTQNFSSEVLAGNISRDRLRGFPSPLDADLCWTRADIEPEQYLIHLSAEDIVAIENAMEGFKSLALPLPALDPSTFVLPTELADRLRAVSKIVHTGIGFAVLRGLDPKKYSEEENTIIYCGMTSHIGIQRSATSHGMAMAHTRDATYDSKPKNIPDGEQLAPSKQKGGMRFHADRMYADILSLYVKGQAAVGGEQYIASSWAIYNKLIQQALEVALVSTLIASSYGISRYRLQETAPKDGSGGNIFDSVAAWGPSPLQFYCSCGIWAVAVVLWFHKHRNSEHQALILAVGILSAICVGATLSMSLEQMGRQAMPWCVVASLLLSAVVDSVLRGLLR